MQENSRKRKKKNHRLSDQKQRPSERLLPVQASNDSCFLKLKNEKGLSTEEQKEGKSKREVSVMLCGLFCGVWVGADSQQPKSMWMTCVSNWSSFEASGARARFAAAFTAMRLLWLMTSVVSGHPGLEG